MRRWSQFGALTRELGALRFAAEQRSDVADTVKVDINELIAEAARAVDSLLESPGDEHKALAAWESVLAAQDFIEGLRHAATDSGQLANAATHLRRRALDAMRVVSLLDGTEMAD
jgi:hypothetical protein